MKQENNDSIRTPEIIAKEIIETTKHLKKLMHESFPHLSIWLKTNEGCYSIHDKIHDIPFEIEVSKYFRSV